MIEVVIPFENKDVWEWNSTLAYVGYLPTLSVRAWYYLNEIEIEWFTDDFIKGYKEGIFLFKDIQDAMLFKLTWCGL